MVADAFHDGVSAAVADGKALAGDAADERLTTGRAVEGHVTDDDVLLGREGRAPRRKDDQPPARQSLAPVVVGVALEHEGDAARNERAERLPGRAGEVDLDGVVGQAAATPAGRDLVAEHGADRAIHVVDGQRQLHTLAVLDRLTAGGNDRRVVEGPVEPVVLRDRAVAAHGGRHVGLVENR